MSRHFSFLTIILGGIVSLGLVTASAAQSGRSATQAAAAEPGPCVDGEGPSYGFFCAPRVQNHGIAACTQNLSGVALTQCREASANSFCQFAGFTRAALFEVNDQGHLREVTCSGRTAVATATSPAATVPSYVGNVYDTDFNEMVITGWNQSTVTGRYEYAGGRIEGMVSGNVLTGYWMQESSPLNCGQQRNGTPHYGRITFTFNVDFSAFTGLWSDCDEAPTRQWNGRFVRHDATTGGGTLQLGASYEPMFDTDFFGNDLPSSFAFQRAGSSWQQCAVACDNDGNCKAFTYVVPGRTEFGECFLKDSVPEPSYGGCCTSGVKGVGRTAASSTIGQPASGRAAREAAAGSRQETVADRLAREAADEAEQRAREETRRGVGGLLDRVIRPD